MRQVFLLLWGLVNRSYFVGHVDGAVSRTSGLGEGASLEIQPRDSHEWQQSNG